MRFGVLNRAEANLMVKFDFWFSKIYMQNKVNTQYRLVWLYCVLFGGVFAGARLAIKYGTKVAKAISKRWTKHKKQTNRKIKLIKKRREETMKVHNARYRNNPGVPKPKGRKVREDGWPGTKPL